MAAGLIWSSGFSIDFRSSATGRSVLASSVLLRRTWLQPWSRRRPSRFRLWALRSWRCRCGPPWRLQPDPVFYRHHSKRRPRPVCFGSSGFGRFGLDRFIASGCYLFSFVFGFRGVRFCRFGLRGLDSFCRAFEPSPVLTETVSGVASDFVTRVCRCRQGAAGIRGVGLFAKRCRRRSLYPRPAFQRRLSRRSLCGSSGGNRLAARPSVRPAADARSWTGLISPGVTTTRAPILVQFRTSSRQTPSACGCSHATPDSRAVRRHGSRCPTR